MEPQCMLMDAVRQINVDLAIEMLANGANVNERSDDDWGQDWTPLHRAAGVYGDYSMAALLLLTGADVNAKEELYSRTPLHEASFWGRDKIVSLLLKHGADKNLVSTAEWSGTALDIAVKLGHCSITKMLTVTLVDAVAAKDVTLASQLLANGADVNEMFNVSDTDTIWTPLHRAAGLHASYEMTELLLKSGARLNARNCEDKTPLFEACFYGNDTIVPLLLQHGADKNIASTVSWGGTPQQTATKNGYDNIVSLLLEHGADESLVSTAECNGTASDTAAKQGHCNNTKMLNPTLADAVAAKDVTLTSQLLSNGADVNETFNVSDTDTIWTPLHRAAGLHASYEMTELLLKGGACVNARNCEDKTPLFEACFYGNATIVPLLLQYGADKSIASTVSWGGTPQQIATNNGYSDIVELLSDSLEFEFVSNESPSDSE